MASGTIACDYIILATADKLYAIYYPKSKMVHVAGQYKLSAARGPWEWILYIPNYAPPYEFYVGSNGYNIQVKPDGIIQTTSNIPKDTVLTLNLSWPKT